MIDLVQEEERIAHLTSMGFGELLSALDAIDPGNLEDRYIEISDGYLRLSGMGKRSREQSEALDRIDSSLQILLGEKGLLVLAGRMLRIFEAAAVGLAVFAGRRPKTRQLLLAQQALARAGRLAADGLRGPVPVDAKKIAALAAHASDAAAALVHLHAGGGWLAGWSNRRQVAEQGLSQLLGDLADHDADASTWQAVGILFDPAACDHAELVGRLKVTRQTAGWVSCLQMTQATAGQLSDLAALVRESLGA